MGVHAQLKSDLLTDGNTPGISSTEGMVRIPGGTFRMGSDKLKRRRVIASPLVNSGSTLTQSAPEKS